MHLIGHVISESSDIEDDYKANLKIKEEFSSVIVAPKFSSPIEAKSYISNMDYFYRGVECTHVLPLFSSGVPVVPIAYSRKFSGLF